MPLFYLCIQGRISLVSYHPPPLPTPTVPEEMQLKLTCYENLLYNNDLEVGSCLGIHGDVQVQKYHILGTADST